jgi:ATP synthase protein I
MPDHDRLKHLSGKIAEIRAEEAKEQAKAAESARETSNMSSGVRAGAELVTLIIAGTAIGWGLDWYFQTKPVFLIIFVLAGIVTGFYEVYRITQDTGGSKPIPRLHNDQKDGTKPPEHQ